jgi:hypothetical protein
LDASRETKQRNQQLNECSLHSLHSNNKQDDSAMGAHQASGCVMCVGVEIVQKQTRFNTTINQTNTNQTPQN